MIFKEFILDAHYKWFIILKTVALYIGVDKCYPLIPLSLITLEFQLYLIRLIRMHIIWYNLEWNIHTDPETISEHIVPTLIHYVKCLTPQCEIWCETCDAPMCNIWLTNWLRYCIVCYTHCVYMCRWVCSNVLLSI